jgi:hypothetical protein
VILWVGEPGLEDGATSEFPAESPQVNRVEQTAERDESSRDQVERERGHGHVASASDAVEDALAHALREATAAGRWDVVSKLAGELEARRRARSSPNVVSISKGKHSAS